MSASREPGVLIRERIVGRAYRFLVARGESPYFAHVAAELLADAAQMCSSTRRERGETAWLVAKRVLAKAGDDFGDV